MHYTIDRFEGEYAVCEDENRNMVNIERSKFPPNAKEGEMFRFDGDKLTLDIIETEARKQRIKKMMDSLWE